MKVADVFRPNPIVVERRHSIQDAAEIMRAQHVDHLIVVDDSTGTTPVGILTGRDLVIEIMAEKVDSDKVTVGDVIGLDLFTASEGQDIEIALRLMREKEVHHLPVVDADGQLTGTLFSYDLMDRLIDENLFKE